jgi:hypothetical protein
MKVKELITELQKYDGELKIMILEQDCYDENNISVEKHQIDNDGFGVVLF